MGNRTTYATGALIIPDGRVVLSIEGNTELKYSMVSGLSVETFIPKITGNFRPETILINEVKTTLGVDLRHSASINKIIESEITIKTTTNFKRNLKLYVYKINSTYTCNVKDSNTSSIMFLSVGQITKQVLNNTLNLSFCAKHMLKYLCTCRNLKNFKGNLS